MPSPQGSSLPAHFHRLAWSNLAAQSAEQVSLAAAPIVAVLTLGAGAGETGVLQAIQTLPFILFAIPVGVLADRMSRPRLMASAEAIRAASLLAILGLTLCGWLAVPLLALLGFLGACGTVAYSVAAPSLVPALVSPASLAQANSRIELARTVAFAAGPALAGTLVGWLGGGWAFGFAAALSICAVTLLSGLHEPHPPQAQSRRAVRDLREGAAFVFTHPLLRPVFVTQAIFNMAFFMVQAVYVPYAMARLGLSASGVGSTLAMYGAGMIAGALGAPRVLRTLPFGIVISIGPLAGCVAAAAMALTILIPSAWLAAGSFFLMGAGPLLWVVSTTTLRQSVTPPPLMGRVSAINVMAYGARPVGALLGAVVGARYGAETCLIAAACGFLMQASVILFSPVPRLAHQPHVAA